MQTLWISSSLSMRKATHHSGNVFLDAMLPPEKVGRYTDKKLHEMRRFCEDTSKEELNEFISSLPEQFFTHKDVMRCYSIYQRNEFQRNGRAQQFGHSMPRPELPEEKPRVVKRRWTEIEVEALKRGVAQFGRGNWIAVIKAFPMVFGPNARTAKELERKWTALVAKGDTVASHDVDFPVGIPAIE
jgi:hypothetical protein